MSRHSRQTMFSVEQSKEFEKYAIPHSWFLVASELHEQAKSLKENSGTAITMHDYVNNRTNNWKASNRATFLLSGFALENILKAFLIYENPNYIENGFLSNSIKTHKLTKLAKKSHLIPYKDRSIKTLEYFEDGLESWARYPCGLNLGQTKEQELLEERMWKNYMWLMKAYKTRFKKLMAKAWQGPHDFEGSYNIEGTWLG